MNAAQKDPDKLLDHLRNARESYERHVVGRNESSIFWRGLVNRWNKAEATARTFPLTSDAAPIETPPGNAAPPSGNWWQDLTERGNIANKIDSQPPPKPTPPLEDPSLHDLGTMIKQAMLRMNYPWSTGQNEQNVVSIEGMDPDGKPNKNRPNAWEDIKCILDGMGKIVGGPWEATTAPGKFWTTHRMDPRGAFIIALGPQSIWTPGQYHDLEVWRQAEDSKILGFRDNAEDFTRHGNPNYYGNIGVHHHGGYNYPHDDINNAAAGCQVIRLKIKQVEFMTISKKDNRFIQGGTKFRLTATVLTAAQVMNYVA
jgi:hypothetical protein